MKRSNFFYLKYHFIYKSRFRRLIRQFMLIAALLYFKSPGIEAQNKMPWHNPQNTENWVNEDFMAFDCKKLSSSEASITEFIDMPLFIHDSPVFSSKSDAKYLMSARSKIYDNSKTTFVFLEISINSINARRSYGDIPRGSEMRLFTLENERADLYILEKVKGKVNRRESRTVYSLVAPIDNKSHKLLRKQMLDRIGINWEEGYQEYEIQNIDLIKNQLNCLKK